MTKLSAKSLPIFASVASLLVLSPMIAYGQSSIDADKLLVTVNLERIHVQLLLTERALEEGDSDSAFAHAFIPHTTTFPSIKGQLKSLDEKTSTELESLLTELPINIRTGERSVEQLRQDIAAIKTIIDTFVTKITLPADSEKSMNSQIVVYLLRDAVQSYQLSEGGLNKIDYENAIGIVDVANARYQLISDSLDKRRKAEVDFFFSELKSSVSNRGDNETVVRLATAIERDLAEDLSIISAG
ncbi:MAG: hypothetical protein ACREBU_11765, partial [Nitrososphaera sp.]